MIKGLKAAMIAWAIVGVLFGLGFVFAPDRLGSVLGLENPPAYVPFLLASIGIAYIVAGVFVIIATRDPLKHVMWVQMAIVWSLLDALAALYFMIRGDVTFRQVGVVTIMDAIFVVAFLALYPWRRTAVD